MARCPMPHAACHHPIPGSAAASLPNPPLPHPTPPLLAVRGLKPYAHHASRLAAPHRPSTQADSRPCTPKGPRGSRTARASAAADGRARDLVPVDAEIRVLRDGAVEKVDERDDVHHDETSRLADGVGVRRQLGALEQDGADHGVLGELGLDERDAVWLHLIDVDLLRERDGLEAGQALAAGDDEATVVLCGHVDEREHVGQHALQLRAVGREHEHLRIGPEDV
eukprot:4708171-Prymnesium_polylepis.1